MKSKRKAIPNLRNGHGGEKAIRKNSKTLSRRSYNKRKGIK